MPNFFSKLNKNLYVKISAIVVIALFLLFTLIIFLFKYLISFSFIEKKFNEITGLKIEFVNPKSNLDYHFNLNLEAQEINIYDSNKKNKYFHIKNPEISTKPIGFLFNRAYFKKINAQNIDLSLKRNSKGEIDLIDSINKDIAKFLNKKITPTRLSTDIKNINLIFDDEFNTKSNIKLNLQNTKLSLSKRKKQLLFNQEGIIETNINNIKQISNLNIDILSKYPTNYINSQNLKLNITLDNVNLYIFNDLVKKYISKDIENIKGNVNLSLKTQENKQKLNLIVINPTLNLKNKKTIAPFKENILLESDFVFQKNLLKIETLNIKGRDLLFKLDGQISEIFSKSPKAELKTQIKNTQINNLIPFIPDNAIFYRPKGIPTLKKSNFYGVANGDIAIKTNPLNIEGNLKVQNVHIPNYPKTYKQNDVFARFIGDKVRIYTRVYTPDNEYVLVDGVSNLDNSLYGKYTVKSTSKIDLSFAQLYLVPIQQIIGFNIGPVPIMDIKGYGNIDINTQGTLSDAQIFGTFNAQNASTTIKGLDAKLTDANCTLIFDDRDIIFEKIKGKLDEADFLLTGKTNIKGEVKLNAKIDNAKSEKIIKIFNNSLISKPYSAHSKKIFANKGLLNANVTLQGIIKDFENESFFEILSPSGNITLLDNEINFDNKIFLSKLSGILEFGHEQKGQFNYNIKNSNFNTNFHSKDSLNKISKGESFNINTEIFSNKIALNDVLSSITELKKYDSLNINFYTKLFLKSQGKLSLNNIDFENFSHNGYLIGLNSQEYENIKFNSGIIKFNNNKANFENLNISFKEGKIEANGAIQNFASKNPQGDLTIRLKNISLDNLNNISQKLKIQNGKIKNGEIAFKNNNLKLNSISLNLNEMPLFLNAILKDIYSSKTIDAEFSTIIDEKSADNIINPHLITPIKITGEIPIKGSFKGNSDNYGIDFNATIPKNSDISFGGANLGDINHKREFQGNISATNDTIKIHNLKLLKYIANQNNKINPLIALKASGQLLQKENLITYDNFKIITNSPINVRVLNLIFKKSLLKKGNFDCNISLNGDIKLPKINGRINLYDLDIPLYNTKIDNIKFNISNKFIDGEFLAKNKQSDAKLKLHALNKLEAPYVIKDFILFSNKIDINDILSNINPTNSKTDIVAKNDFSIQPTDLIIEKGSFDFKEVQYDKIEAQNLKGNLSYKEGVADLKDVSLNIADGSIYANGKYEIKTTKLNLDAKMDDCDSNALAKNFLKLPNQIFGKIDGTLLLSGKNLHTYQGINSIKSDISFSIDNGKMPKLGSLEYLLRAGNLFKNGILGFSLNNLIEVLTPYKTGEFEKISGNLIISNGEIENLNILSKGKNLSLYLDGNYSILENFADIKIYGKLSQNISNALGALGNASINQLVETFTQVKKNKNEKNSKLQQALNKIPPIENNSANPRYFKVRVLGDINKENYIKNFDWINN